jgi:ATP-dependent Lhr-like helicase
MIDQFHPAVQAWFAQTFTAPTASQQQGWASIRGGRATLIAAPTGSGKTLAAFLSALNDLVCEAEGAALPDEVRVVYVSPLKALSSDIHKNLAEPRRGIRRVMTEMGLPAMPGDQRGADRRHDPGRACRDASHAAAHPGDDARIAVPAPHRQSAAATCCERPAP